MTLDLVRLLIDFGLVVLIWMVQLIVYPSFLYYTQTNLCGWHKRYTANLSIIVMPLMFGQLGIYAFQAILLPTLFSITGFAIVILLWAITFIQFVPLHRAISEQRATQRTLRALVLRNWIRTGLWSLLSIWSIWSYLNT
ncbi:MAG: hypothetical protein WA775_15925 [Psychroserpens sp.]|uniref:hypothetical protein n=1 Tax=Psychroserpens sp. TaxID=2020870 RepID=UPI003C7290AF